MPSSPRKSSPVGVIGLGLLGTALAERLLDNGYQIVVHNRTKDKAQPLLDRGAVWSDNPLADCDRVVICLYTTDVVEQVLASMDVALRARHVLIDTTTGDPDQTENLGKRLAGRGVDYLESPIAASSHDTREGRALAIVAGPPEVYRNNQDLFSAIAAKSLYVGAWGNAAKVKLVNNLVLGLNRLALAESLVFAESLGLDPATVLDVLRQGTAYSMVMDVKGQKMVTSDFAVQARLAQHAKDVRLILQQADAAGISLPMSRLHLELLQQAELAGLGDLDNSAIISLVREIARLEKRPNQQSETETVR